MENPAELVGFVISQYLSAVLAIKVVAYSLAAFLGTRAALNVRDLIRK